MPVALALGMLDRAIEVLQVETEVGQEFVTPEGLENLKKEHATKKPVVVKRAGEQCEFSGSDARRLGFVSFLAADRRDVVKALELPATAVEDDPSLEGGWRAVRVDLKGPIRADSVDRAQRMIEDQIRDQGANFICLWIDSPGGRMDEALRLANFLALDLDPSKVRTVAYVPNEARSVAAVVALACDQVVVYPRTVLGGSGAYEPTAQRDRRRPAADPRETGASQGAILVAGGGDDRSPPDRLSRHAAGRGRILLRRGVGRADSSRANGKRARSLPPPAGR